MKSPGQSGARRGDKGSGVRGEKSGEIDTCRRELGVRSAEEKAVERRFPDKEPGVRSVEAGY